MKTLNELYKVSCKPGYTSCKKITDKITLIENFFEDFDSARNFFINREKWECIEYQNYSKPGYETIFPSWVGKSLLEKYILSNNIIENHTYNTTECNHFYPQPDFIWSLSSVYAPPNSSISSLPHYDSIEREGILTYICLINLNQVPVTTNFYTFRDEEYCDNKNVNTWQQYNSNLREEFFKYCGKDSKNTTRKNALSFLNDHKKIETKLIREIKYNPNQAIIYPANLFHSPTMSSEFSEENPRTLLRISFDQKIRKSIHYS